MVDSWEIGDIYLNSRQIPNSNHKLDSEIKQFFGAERPDRAGYFRWTACSTLSVIPAELEAAGRGKWKSCQQCSGLLEDLEM
jgi:hypothetical protein